jgi:hypothetical protein
MLSLPSMAHTMTMPSLTSSTTPSLSLTFPVVDKVCRLGGLLFDAPSSGAVVVINVLIVPFMVKFSLAGGMLLSVVAAAVGVGAR